MTFSGPYEGIQRPYGRIWAGGEKISKPWLPTGVLPALPILPCRPLRGATNQKSNFKKQQICLQTCSKPLENVPQQPKLKAAGLKVVLVFRLDASFGSYGLVDLTHIKFLATQWGRIQLIVGTKNANIEITPNYDTNYPQLTVLIRIQNTCASIPVMGLFHITQAFFWYKTEKLSSGFSRT